MKNGYDDGIAGTNNAGFYIGGTSNVNVYVDNCYLYAKFYPVVLRSSGGEQNNNVYFSNTNIDHDMMQRYLRNDGSTNKIYIGTGNNFGIIDTYKESGTIETNENYGANFPNY